MPDSYQIFDIFVGVFSLLTVVPFVVTYLNWFLPRAQMRELHETFHDTQSHLYKNIEDGLLGQHLNVAGFQHRLDLLKSRTEDIDADARRAITYPQNLIKMLSGLSRRIYVLCGEVKALRADILTTSARERERLWRCSVASSVDKTATSGSRRGSTTASTLVTPNGDLKDHPPFCVTPSVDTAPPSPLGEQMPQADNDSPTRDAASFTATVAPPLPEDPSLSSHPSRIEGSPRELLRQLRTASSTSTRPCKGRHELHTHERAVQRDVPGLRRSSTASSSLLSANARHKRHGDTLSRMRVFTRFLRNTPSRSPHMSPGSACDYLVVPREKFVSIELVSDDDESGDEWENVASRYVLPV